MDLETLDWDDELLELLQHPAVDAAGDPAVVRPERRTATTRGRRAARRGDPAHRRPRRPAGGHRRPGLLRARRGQEHLRHRQLHAAQHRHRAGPVEQRPAHDGLLQVRRPGRRVRPGGLDRGDRLGRAVAARPARHHPRRRASPRRSPGRSRTTAASTSCPRSPACSRRTGAPTPAARSSGCPGTTPARTSPGPRWRRSATRSKDVVDAMAKDSGVDLDVLKVDGGITANELCMQIQADVLGVPVSKPVVAETTALGAAYAAGLAVGFWKNTDELRENWNEDKRWDPELERRAAPDGVRRLAEGRAAHTGLGGGRLTSGSTGGTPWEPPPHCHRRPGPRRSDRMAEDASSTSWSSAAAWSAPARRWTPRPAACGRPGRGARLGQRHVQPVQQAASTAACATWRCSTSGWCARRCGSAGCCSASSRRTWSGRCRSSTRCSTGSGSGRTSAPGVLLYDTMALASPAGVRGRLPRHRHLTRRGALRLAPVAAQGLAGRRDPVLRRPGRRRPAHADARPDGRARTARCVATRTRVIGLPARGRAGHRRAGPRPGDRRASIEVRARQVINATGVWTDETQAMVGGRGQFHVRASKGVHLVVPRDRIHSDTGLILRTEKSVLFVIPWGRHWIIGTTDTDWNLDKAHPAASRAGHRLPARPRQRGAHHAADPRGRRGRLRRAAAAAGRRVGVDLASCPASTSSATPVPGLVVVAGGKYTTYRVMAKDAVDAAAHGAGRAGCRTSRAPSGCRWSAPRATRRCGTARR